MNTNLELITVPWKVVNRWTKRGGTGGIGRGNLVAFRILVKGTGFSKAHELQPQE